MSLPHIGQFVVMQVPEGIFEGYYHCQVQDINSHYLLVDIPLQMDSSQPQTLPVGTAVIIHYADKTQTPCEFDSSIEAHLLRKSALIVLARPGTQNIRRKQRREYVRVPVALPVAVVAMDVETRQFFNLDSITKDLSGGGLSIIVRKNDPIRIGDYLGVRFEIVPENRSYEIVAKARVVNIKPAENQSSKKICALKFLDIKNTEQQLIIQYVFKRQIELRERGWLQPRF